MTVEFDPRGDFAVVADGQQKVTLQRPGTSHAWTIAHAVRAVIRASEARSSGGTYTEDDVVWHLEMNGTGGRPEPGDWIMETAGRRWTVLAARESATGRWRCVCRDLAIEHGLDQYVDVEAAVFTKDASGAERATWHPWRTGIVARIQPSRTVIDHCHDRHVASKEAKIFMAESLPLDQTHRIKGPDGTIYRVVKCENVDRIDRLMTIDVVADE